MDKASTDDYASIESALTDALTSVTVETRDKAAVALAYRYARALDNREPEILVDVNKLGAALLTVLESLMMTPRARANVMKGGKDDTTPTAPSNRPPDQLRARRASRLHNAANMDAAAS